MIVPIKGFVLAKGRLASALDPGQRADLARRMAATTLAAAGPLPVWVVCNDGGVTRWALERGAGVVWAAVDGLDASVERAVELIGHRYRRLIVAHADLPRARDLSWLADAADDEVVVVTDRVEDGSNVVSLPTGHGFRFAYGPGSGPRHLERAREAGLRGRMVQDDDLSWDVDHPDDLAALTALADHQNEGTVP